MQRRVIKLGGSLLDFADLRDAFPRWLEHQPPAENVLIVGGGPWVDFVRDLDGRFALGDETAHWLSIRAMGLAARLAAALWPDFVLLTRLDELTGAFSTGRTKAVFDAEAYLRCEEPHQPGVPLAVDWTVTSDSIAACVAKTIGAGELVLLKSSLPPRSPISCEEAASLGFVDVFFPRAADMVPNIRAINLRSPEFAEAAICS